jgi:hypothetical protein
MVWRLIPLDQCSGWQRERWRCGHEVHVKKAELQLEESQFNMAPHGPQPQEQPGQKALLQPIETQQACLYAFKAGLLAWLFPCLPA